MSTTTNTWSVANVFFILASVCLSTYVLWAGAGILIPIAVAGLVWFALTSVARLLQDIGPAFRGKLILSHIVAWFVMIFLATLLVNTISATVYDFIAQLPAYGAQLTDQAVALTRWAQEQSASLTALVTGQEVAEVSSAENDGLEAQVGAWFSSLTSTITDNLPSAATSLLSATQSGVVLISTILIYLIFFYSESSSFPKKLAALNREEADHERWSALIALITSRLASYIRIKTLTSVLTGGLGFLLMASLNVNFALVFALLLFLLNYIPVVGSLISSILPIVLFIVDPSFTLGAWFILVIGLLLIQQGVGSVLEPRLLADSFNISSILVMTSLVFWGAIWGVFGMLISAPITAALVILAANFKGSRQLAIFMSADGNIDDLRARR